MPDGLREDVDLLRFEEAAAVVEAAPAAEPTTPAEWVRRNLFSGPFNTLITIVSAAIAGFGVYQALRFVFVTADWSVVQANMKAYMVGPFPVEELWRVWAIAYFLALLAGLSFGLTGRRIQWSSRKVTVAAVAALAAVMIVGYTAQTTLVRVLTAGLPLAVLVGVLRGRRAGPDLRRPVMIVWLLTFPAIIVLLSSLDGVPPEDWGGFFFNIIAATIGIVASFPIGILLALGRRSELPVVRTTCVIFIEIFRGVPLVAWLIFSKFVVDLLLPPESNPPDIIKAFIVMTMFSAAYVGEIVRGGLQSVGRGQYEAARALGLSTIRLTVLIVLPQALRATIPAMIGHFISLFKDTSLFTAIQVTDLLAAARRSASIPEFFGSDRETLLFAGLFFWVVAFSMSRWSQRLEVRLGVGER